MIRDWGDLPMELLSSVLGRLESLSDYFEFSLVCTSWHSVAKENRSQRAKMVSTRYRPPVLLFSDGKKDTWYVYNVTVDKILGLQLNVPDKLCCGCSNGWLINVEGSTMVNMTNPFLRVKGKKEEENSIIRPPPLDGMKRRYFERAAIFGDPLMNIADDCIVMVYGMGYKLAYMVLGKDTTWTYIDEPYIADIVCFQVYSWTT